MSGFESATAPSADTAPRGMPVNPTAQAHEIQVLRLTILATTHPEHA